MKLKTYKLKTPFKTKLLKDENNSIIHSYKSHSYKNNKKALLFLTGGAQLKFSYYIKKLVDDLIEFQNIEKEYDIFVFENTREINYLCVDYISNWMERYICPKYTHITICGLSNGGSIGSHVMSNIISRKINQHIKFKLITIDSIFYMCDFLKKNENNIFFRKDIWLAYWITFYHSLNHTHLQSNLELTDIFNSKDYQSFLIIFERMYGIDKKIFRKKSTMNLNIGDNCDIVNIYSKNDPIVEAELNEKYYIKQQKKGMVQTNIKNVPFNMVTHNTQMVTEKSSKKFCKLFVKYL